MTGRNFGFFAAILITVITFWSPLLPDIYSKIVPDSTSTKSSTVTTFPSRDRKPSSLPPTDTSNQKNRGSILADKQTAFWLKIVGAVMIAFLTIYSHYVKDYRPFLGYDELRKEALDHVFKPIQEKMKAQGLDNLRFAVMQRKCWIRLTRFIQFGRLVPIYYLGDTHMERDKSLSYWYLKVFFIEIKQGVTGHAFLAERDIFADMGKLQLNRFIQSLPASPSTNPGSTAPVGPGSTAPASPGSTAPANSGSTASAGPGSTAPASSGSTASAGPGSTAPASSGSTAPAGPSSTAPAGPGSTAISGMWGWLYDKQRLGLTNYRIGLLSDLKMSISIYIISWRGSSYRCRGTVNIDSVNSDTTRLMFDEFRGREIKQELRKYLQDSAQFISRWL